MPYMTQETLYRSLSSEDDISKLKYVHDGMGIAKKLLNGCSETEIMEDLALLRWESANCSKVLKGDFVVRLFMMGYKAGRQRKPGYRNGRRSQFNEKMITQMITLKNTGVKVKDIAKTFGISRVQCSRLINGHVKNPKNK